MGLLEKLFKKKKKEEEIRKTEKTETELETLCGEDTEVYEALYTTILLHPQALSTSMEEAAERGDYGTAGGLALWKGDLQKVKEYFGKKAEQNGKKLKILEIPERAIKKAQEYYTKYPETLSVKTK